LTKKRKVLRARRKLSQRNALDLKDCLVTSSRPVTEKAWRPNIKRWCWNMSSGCQLADPWCIHRCTHGQIGTYWEGNSYYRFTLHHCQFRQRTEDINEMTKKGKPG